MYAITPSEASELFETNKAVFFDIRSENEFSEAHLPGSILVSGNRPDPEFAAVVGDKVAIFYCTSGMRTKNAWANIKDAGLQQIKMLEGGLDAWAEAGLPVIKMNEKSPPISIARQVQIVVGLMIILLSALTVTGHIVPAYLLAGVGAGLTFAGITGSCMMARLVMLAPWNRR